jgi:hypothetical protein
MGIVTIHLTVDETDKLLQLLGHDSAVLEQVDLVTLVKALYRTLIAFDGTSPSATLTFQVSGDQLLIIHRYFTTAAFGPGGREFQQKLAEAFVAVERLEDIPEIEAADTIDGQPFGRTERLGLAQWEDLESW